MPVARPTNYFAWNFWFWRNSIGSLILSRRLISSKWWVKMGHQSIGLLNMFLSSMLVLRSAHVEDEERAWWRHNQWEDAPWQIHRSRNSIGLLFATSSSGFVQTSDRRLGSDQPRIRERTGATCRDPYGLVGRHQLSSAIGQGRSTRTHRSNWSKELRLLRSKVVPYFPAEISSFVFSHRTKSFDWNYLIWIWSLTRPMHWNHRFTWLTDLHMPMWFLAASCSEWMFLSCHPLHQDHQRNQRNPSKRLSTTSAYLSLFFPFVSFCFVSSTS